MNRPRISLLGSQEKYLVGYLQSDAEGCERAAVILFRRFVCSLDEVETSDRYVAIEIIPFEKSWITSSSSSHISFELKFLRDLFRRCEEESLVFGFIHNHPGGFPNFSDIDNENEITLLKALTNRNGSDVHLVAMLWTNNTWKARVRNGRHPETPETVRSLLVIDQHLRMFNYAETSVEDESITARNAAAFGQPFVDKLSSLRVGVIGAGGTGSPTVMLLARAGIGEIVLIDNDKLEKSNLNRVRGAGFQDVGKNKARILQETIKYLGLETKIAALESLVDLDPIAVDAISTCDIIIGCTDDQIGREVLNAATYIYAIPYIDVGLGGQISNDNEGQPFLRYHFGRISTILPEHGECLFCQGVIKNTWIRHQYALRSNPSMAAEEARDRYLEGGGEQAPGVGPFTSAVADYGVATLFDLIKPFRKFPGELRRDHFRIDFVKMELRSYQEKNNENCVYCRKKEYLLTRENYRLNRPALGKRNVSI